MNPRERFPLNALSDVMSCITYFNKQTLRSFNEKLKALKKVLQYSDILTFNQYIIEHISKSQVSRDIANGLLFLIPCNPLPVRPIFEAIYRIHLYNRKARIDKAIRHLRKLFSEEITQLNKFGALFTTEKCCYIHFLVMANIFNIASKNTKMSIMAGFVAIAPNFDKNNLTHLVPFISSITTNMFFQYVRPYLDSMMLRSPDSILQYLPDFILPLSFSINYFPKRTTANFVETLCSLCESQNNSLAEQCQTTLSKIATRISPKCMVFNSKSIIAFFSAIEPSKISIDISFQLLDSKQFSPSARIEIKYFLKRAIDAGMNEFSIDDFIFNRILPEKDYSLLYLIADKCESSTELLQSIKNINDPYITILKYKFDNTIPKESDISVLTTPKALKEMNKIEMNVLTNLFSSLYTTYPDIIARGLISALSISSYPSEAFQCIKNCLVEFNQVFINTVISSFRARGPQVLRSLDISPEFFDKLNVQQKTLLLIAGYDINDDDPTFVQNVLSVTDGDWGKKTNQILFNLINRPNCHIEIVKELSKVPIDKKYLRCYSNIIKTFNVESDRNLIERIFHNKGNDNLPESFIRDILEILPHYSSCAKVLSKALFNLQHVESISRGIINSCIPLQRVIREFDFILFLPFMKHLLAEKDYISKAAARLLGQFSYIDFDHLSLFSNVVDFGDDESIVNFIVKSNLDDHTSTEIAKVVSRSREMAEIAMPCLEENEKFKYSLPVCILTLYDLYSSFLPDFKEYLALMVGYKLENDIDTSVAIANAIEKAPNYVEKFDENIELLLNNAQIYPGIVVRILANLSGFKTNTYKIIKVVFAMKITDFDPNDFNQLLIPKVTQKYPEEVIDFYFSKPNFEHIHKDTFKCLKAAFINSRRPEQQLLDLLENYLSLESSDRTIAAVLDCMGVLQAQAPKMIVKHATHIVEGVDKYNITNVALHFHFANIPNKENLLKDWITSPKSKVNKIGLETFRYIFLNDNDKELANSLLQELVKYCDNPDPSIVQAANSALNTAASTLGIDALDQIVPSLMKLLTTQLTRRAETAIINVLLSVGKRFPDLFLNHIDNIFLLITITGISQSMETFLKFLEKVLFESDYPASIRLSFNSLLKKENPSDSLSLILSEIDEINEFQKIVITVFHLTENYLPISDQNLKLKAYQIISLLDLQSPELDKAIYWFILIRNDPMRYQIKDHFRNFVSRLSQDKKEYVFNQLWKVAQEASSSGSNGTALLLGCLIVEINDTSKLDLLISTLDRTNNISFQETLLSAIEQLYELKQSSLPKYHVLLEECILKTAASESLLPRIQITLLKIGDSLEDKSISPFIYNIILELSNRKPSIREMCISVLYEMNRKYAFMMTNYLDENVYKALITALHVFNNNRQFDKVHKMFTHIKSDEFKGLYTSNCDFNLYLGRFLSVPELSTMVVPVLISIFNDDKYVIDDIQNIVEKWSHIANFQGLFESIIGSSALTSYGMNMLILAVNNVNGIDEFTTKVSDVSSDTYQPKIMLDASTISDVCQRLIKVPTNCTDKETIAGISFIYPFLMAFHKFSNQKDSIELQMFKILASLNEILPIMPPRATSPQIPHSKVMPQTVGRSPSMFYGESPNPITSNSDIERSLINKTLRDAFVKVGTLYAGKELNYYPLSEMLMTDLLNYMSEYNVEFFINDDMPFDFFSRFFELMFTTQYEQYKKCAETVNKVLTNLPDIEYKFDFIQTMSKYFITFKPKTVSRTSIIPNEIIITIIEKIFLSPEGKEYVIHAANFFMATFPYIKENIKEEYATRICTYMLSALVNDQSISDDEKIPYLDIFTAISYFFSFFDESLGIATLMTCLYYIKRYKEISDVRCDLLNIVDRIIESYSNANYVILLLSQHLGPKCPFLILEAISHALGTATLSLPQEFLGNLWKEVSVFYNRKYEDNKHSLFHFVAKIGAQIINLCDSNDYFDIVKLLFEPSGFALDTSVVSTFYSNLRKPENFVHEEAIKTIKKDIYDSTKIIEILQISQVLTDIGVLTNKERMVFLVRSLFTSGYAIPMMCYQELQKLAPEIREMDIKDAGVLVSGIYFASTSNSNPQLKEFARTTLREILVASGPDKERAKAFKEEYFKSIDQTLLAALNKFI